MVANLLHFLHGNYLILVTRRVPRLHLHPVPTLPRALRIHHPSGRMSHGVSRTLYLLFITLTMVRPPLIYDLILGINYPRMFSNINGMT